MGYQSKARDKQEGRKRNPVENAEDGDDAKHGGSKNGRRGMSGFENTLGQDEAPGDGKGLDRVGEGVRLKSPGDVGRGDEQDGDATVSLRLNKLVDSPVLQHEAEREHEHPQCVEDDNGRDLTVVPVADPQPPQQKHGQAVDGPQGGDAPNGILARELPGQPDGIAEDLAGDDFRALEVLVGV